MQASLAGKVNASDLASLMPQGGGDEGASLMPKLIEIQSKMAQLEGKGRGSSAVYVCSRPHSLSSVLPLQPN